MPRPKSDDQTGKRSIWLKIRISEEELTAIIEAAGGGYAGTWARRELAAAAKRAKTKASRKK
jgi:hypothetical protein